MIDTQVIDTQVRPSHSHEQQWKKNVLLVLEYGVFTHQECEDKSHNRDSMLVREVL